MPTPTMNKEEQQAYDKALGRIEECRREGKQRTVLHLHLVGLGLTTLPQEWENETRGQ